MTTRGITHGVTPTTLAPGRPVTCAELVTFLYRFAGEPPAKVDADGICLLAGEQHQLMAAEALSFQLLNELRAGLGLNPLVRGEAMDAVARTWSVTLDSLGSLKHRGGPYAENLGWLSNGSVSAEVARVMHDLWLNSELHDNTMIRHSYGEVGVGFWQSDGRWHAPHVFR
ncbi:MAG: CAP domain-containing protein [Acidimicrobiales bacterium]|nr:CAP domain-containing protein [Acidimicrobiales bacterium]